MYARSDHEDRGDDQLVLYPCEVQRLLRLSRGGIYQALANGQIQSRRIGRRYLIPRALLMERLLPDKRNDASEDRRAWSDACSEDL